MAMKRQNRKGQMLHLITFGIATIFVAMSFLFMALFVNSVFETLDDNEGLDKNIMNKLETTNNHLPTILDAAYAFFVVGVSIAFVVSVFFVDTSPVFMFISLPIFLIMALANAVMANVIDEFGTTEALLPIYVNFPMMQFFTSHWVAIVVVVGGLSLIAFFGGKSVLGGGA